MRSLAILAALMMSGSAYASDQKIAQCILCHGTKANGNEVIRAPRIAGMQRWYLAEQLESFRGGMRGTHAIDVSGSEMRIVARSLSKAEMTSVIDAIARMPVIAPPKTVQGDAPRGEKLFAGCARCHGGHGEGSEALHAPALAHSSDWYLVTQLNGFKNGWRGGLVDGSVGGPMNAAVLALPDAQAILDVVAYINTLE